MRLKKILLTAGLAATSLFAAIPRAKATTCPNAIAITGNSVTNQALVCGTTNDITSTNTVVSCGSTLYYGGQEALYTWTPTTSGLATISFNGGTTTNYAGIFLFQGCPTTAGTTCMGSATGGSAFTTTLTTNVFSGVTYYLMFDTWPTPNSPCPGTFSISIAPGCSSAPTAGTASATVINTCPGGTSVLTTTGQTTTGGVTTQWQSSTTSTTAGFTNIAGATGTSFTTPALTTTTYYRNRVLCPFTNDSSFSNVITVTVTPPAATTAVVPYFQDFDTWISSCSTNDRPGTEWTTMPFNGNNAWRRRDQGATAAWTSVAFGAPVAFSTSDSNYARFHSYSTSAQGSMMLNVNMSAAGTKLISFDYINTSGTDTLFVELSTNGGTSYILLGSIGVSAVWAPVNLSTTATSATAMLRFRAKGDFGTTDIGMDNLNISVATCPPPSAVTISAITPNSATVSWTASSPAPGVGYHFEVRTSGAAGSGSTGLIQSGTQAGTSLSLTALAGQTMYTVFVRSVCAAGDSSAYTSGSFNTLIDCATATNITACGVSQSFSIAPGVGQYNPVITAVGTAPYGTPGREKLYTFTAPTTGVYTLNVTASNSLTFADYFVKPASGGCTNSGWTFIDDALSAPNTDTFTMTGGVQYYILVDLESATASGAMTQTFSIICPPTCGTPTALSASAIATTSASIGWTQPAIGTPAQWQISIGSGITSPGAGTTSFVTTNPASLTGLTAGTSYTVYVRAVCGAGDTSQWSAGLTFQTQCLPFTLPFAENFNTFLPACWSLATGFLLNTPSALTPSTGNGWTSDGYFNVGTSGATKINLYSNFRRDWLITPSIELGTTPINAVLEFNMAVTVWNSTTAYDSLGTDDTLAVVVSYNNGATWSSANALRVFTAADDTLTSQRYYMPFTGSGQVKVGFYASDGTVINCSTCANPADNDVFIDSVRIVQCNAPVVNLGTDTTLCGIGLSTVLNAGPGTGYIWSTGDTTQSITVSAPGTYSVTVVNGSLGCTGRDTITVSTGVLPVVNLGPDVTVCGNVASLLLDAGNPGSNYVWSSPVATLPFTTQIIDLGPVINAGNIGSASTTINTAPVYATVTNAAGCSATDSVNVSVVFTPRVTGIATAGTDPMFSFTPVADSFATTYNWNFGDGSAAVTTQNATHTYNTNGTFTVTLIVTNACASDTVTTTVTVTSASVSDVALGQGSLTLYPNPTAADATLVVSNGLKLRGVQVMSATGQLVMDRTLDGGTRATLNTSVLAPGIYTLRVQLDKGVVVRKLEVLK